MRLKRAILLDDFSLASLVRMGHVFRNCFGFMVGDVFYDAPIVTDNYFINWKKEIDNILR